MYPHREHRGRSGVLRISHRGHGLSVRISDSGTPLFIPCISSMASSTSFPDRWTYFLAMFECRLQLPYALSV